MVAGIFLMIVVRISRISAHFATTIFRLQVSAEQCCQLDTKAGSPDECNEQMIVHGKQKREQLPARGKPDAFIVATSAVAMLQCCDVQT